MLITSEFELIESPDRVWEFFNDIPMVASCLPGADLSEQIDENTYAGEVVVAMGPVKFDFEGEAKIRERDEENKRIIVDASGADVKGRGQATLVVDATVTSSGSGSRVSVAQELHLSGTAAQYGRGIVQDVTAHLLDDFAANMEGQLAALESGEEFTAGSSSASGFAIAFRALRKALARVARRFFLPYKSATN